MSRPEYKNRQYPKGDPSAAEYRRNGSIQKKYDYPTSDGLLFYGAGNALIRQDYNSGIMAYTVDTGMLAGSVTKSSLLDIYNANFQGLSHFIPDSIRQSSDQALIVMRAQRTGDERFILLMGNTPFNYYQASEGELIRSELSLSHVVMLKKGDGLLVASPDLVEIQHPTVRSFMTRRSLEERSLDPAIRLLFDAEQRANLLQRDGWLISYDPKIQAVMAIRAVAIPEESKSPLQRLFRL